MRFHVIRVKVKITACFADFLRRIKAFSLFRVPFSVRSQIKSKESNSRSKYFFKAQVTVSCWWAGRVCRAHFLPQRFVVNLNVKQTVSCHSPPPSIPYFPFSSLETPLQNIQLLLIQTNLS